MIRDAIDTVAFALAPLVLAAAMLLAACSDCSNPKTFLGGAGFDFPGFGRVYECNIGSEEPQRFEYCWDDDADSLAQSLSDHHGGVRVACWTTNRHAGPCDYYCSPEDDGLGGPNAFNGCWCPNVE